MTCTQETMDKKEVANATTKKGELSKKLLWGSIVSCLLSIQYGYNMWILYSPSVLLHDLFNITKFEELEDPASQMVLVIITIALFPLGATFGSLPVFYLMDRFGRKGALVITAFSSIICPILLAFANKITVHEYTIFARFYTGICTGIISIVVPLYLGEISPTSLRGGITMMTHLFLVFGLLLAQILSVPELLGTQKGFSILMGISGVMPFFAILLLPFFPESPRYLFIQKKDEEKARQVLKILRDRNNVEEEIEELRQEDLLEKAEKNMNPMKLLWTPTLRWQVITTVVLMGGQQLDGINAVHFYAQRIYLSTGMEEGHAHYLRMSSISMGCCSILLGMCLADSKGHRILFLAGFGICCIICVLLTMTLEMQGTIPEVAYISTCLVQVFLFGHSIAPGPLSSVIVLELFLQSSRSSAFVIAGFVQWFTHFLIGLIFLHVETHIGAYSFLIFWPISVAVFVYIFKFLPEMKGRTFVDIRRLMAIQTAKKIAVKGQAGKQELKKHPA